MAIYLYRVSFFEGYRVDEMNPYKSSYYDCKGNFLGYSLYQASEDKYFFYDEKNKLIGKNSHP